MKKIITISLLVLISMSIFAVSVLTPEEEEGILLMREEEKLARDVYAYLFDLWGINVFTNISDSEQKHTDTVAYLIELYDLEDPVLPEVGVFSNPALQELYDSLIEQGSESLLSAIEVGIAIEELDIKDLEELISQTDNEIIIRVYENLLAGSENHLEAFNNQYNRYQNPDDVENNNQMQNQNNNGNNGNNGGNGGGNGNGGK